MSLRICQAASEVTPFAKTGGLGDVVAGLSRALGRAGHDVRVFLPFYARLAKQDRSFTVVEFLRDVEIRLGARRLVYSVFTSKLPDSDVDVYFVHCPALYHHDSIYSSDWDEYLRFALLSRASIESCQRMGWSPQVFHVHDWHTALIPLYLKTVYAWDRIFARTRTVLTLHNLGYSGTFGRQVLGELGLAEHARLLFAEDLAAGRVSFLKTGLLHADVLTTVSRTYAREILTPEHGFGLDPVLRARADRLIGIVNGVDYGEWDPSSDPHLPHHYSPRSLAGKGKMRRTLLEKVGLPEARTAPVVGMVSRLTAQKGLDLLFDTVPDLLSQRDLRFVALGNGEERYESFFSWLQGAYPGKAWYFRGYHEELAHWIEAGADLFLMPSRYEPCGLNQMYSLKYGTPPIVRRTGGLADTVTQWDPAARQGTGFLFDHFTPEGLRWALERALEAFGDPAAWKQLQLNGMAQDFSWERQVREYEALYARLTSG
ncbi:MAG TPA: glycogen synthase GlgA [Thermoanaerobaculia bacterium]|nr:glycogen synthase GlgA [Thermoanaerobaculia bacterium]